MWKILLLKNFLNTIIEKTVNHKSNKLSLWIYKIFYFRRSLIMHKKIYWRRAKDFSTKKFDDPNLIIGTCRVCWSRGRGRRSNRRRNSRYASGSAVIVFDSSGHDRWLLLFIPIHVYFPGHEFTARAVIEPAGPDSFHCPRKTFRFAISPRLTAELSFEAV